MQTLFLRGPSATLRMLILVIASVVIMTADHRWNQLQLARNTLSHLLYPIQYIVDLPVRFYYWSDEALTSREMLENENKQLKNLHLQTRVQLQKLDILEKENERLRELMGATPKTTEKVLIAEIINVDVDPYRHLLKLNKSSTDGVYIGQPVIDAQGVIGQIKDVDSFSSTAILITDISHALPVQIDRTGLRTIAFGTGNIGFLDLKYIPHNADIREGDVIITSGLGGRFPPNYPVGVITNIDRTAGDTFVSVQAEPIALLDRSRELLLVWYKETAEENAE